VKGGFGNMMKQAQKLQEQMMALQEEVGKKKVEATAGGGMVTVEANGKQEIVSIKIDPEVVSKDDVQMLEDLILAASNEALRKSRELVQQEMGKITGGLKIPGLGMSEAVTYYPEPVARLIEALQRLPGVGPKTAQRMTFFLLKRPHDEVRELSESLLAVKERIVSCSTCFNITDQDPCRICADPARDPKLLCVVEEPNDLLAMERTGEYRGRYHVLLGALSPLEGIGPDDLKVRELLLRLETDSATEVILATNPNVEGEATAIYLAKLLRPLVMRVTRIARGLPVGGDLEYADQVTLTKALEGRREIS